MLDFIINPTLQLLVFLYNIFGNNLGLAIIALTVVFRGALVPFSISSIRSAKKMQDLKPHLDKLKKKHTDKAKLQQAQLELYKQNGINPAAGCLPQVVQLILLIALYQVFIRFLDGEANVVDLKTNFLWLDLSKPDPIYILPILAGLTQFIFSLMMRSGLEQHQAPKKAPKKTQQKQEDALDMATAMQSQMLYLMPAMTTLIALRFPSGLGLYWVITTLFSVVQQYIIAGPGGLILYFNKAKQIIKSKSLR